MVVIVVGSNGLVAEYTVLNPITGLGAVEELLGLAGDVGKSVFRSGDIDGVRILAAACECNRAFGVFLNKFGSEGFTVGKCGGECKTFDVVGVDGCSFSTVFDSCGIDGDGSGFLDGEACAALDFAAYFYGRIGCD